MDNNFSNLSPGLQAAFLSVPVFVPGSQNPDAETEQQAIARQDRFLKLPKGIRWKLASFETGIKIEIIGQKYQFELLRLANITRLIREYYFGEVRFEDFATEIEKRMSVSLLTAQEITRYIKSEIIDWDPWAQYVAKLPKMTAREMFERKLKIAGTEITSGYVELRGSDDLEDPTIKNWIQDYITHLGYGQHSQMERTQYIFHSENGKNLSSQDREKLGIILRSFDENIPLPVDEENGEIIFNEQRSMINDQQKSMIKDQRTVNNNPMPTAVLKSQPIPQPSFAKASAAVETMADKPAGRQESFIKPYNPIPEPPRQVLRPAPVPVQNLPPRQASAPPQNFVRPNPVSRPQPQEIAESPVHFASQDGPNPEIEKYFSASEIPPIKIHSMTEHNEPKPAPQSLPPRPTIQQPPQQPERPKYRVINPFEPRIAEPRLDGNIVDLSEK